MNFNHTDLRSNVLKYSRFFLSTESTSCSCAKQDRYVHVGNPFFLIIESKMWYLGMLSSTDYCNADRARTCVLYLAFHVGQQFISF